MMFFVALLLTRPNGRYLHQRRENVFFLSFFYQLIIVNTNPDRWVLDTCGPDLAICCAMVLYATTLTDCARSRHD